MSASPAEKTTQRARKRIRLVAAGFATAMGAAIFGLAQFASDGPPQRRAYFGAIETGSISVERAEIVDRRGALLAGAAPTYAIYLDRSFLALPEERAEAAAQLSELFPDDAERIGKLLIEGGSETITLKFRATPLEAQAALDLGIAGLYRTERADRVYFAGRATSHVLGYVSVDGVGQAGVEGALDARLRAPGAPSLRLSLDLRVQIRVRDILLAAKERFTAEAAAAVVMDARTGEVLAMVSLPDFDPHRVSEQAFAEGSADPRFHWAISTGYEPGSTLKTATWALALESGVGEWDEIFDAPGSLTVGGETIHDHKTFGRIAFQDAFARSSNIVAAQLALRAGAERQQAFFRALGFTEPTSLELLEARQNRPVLPRVWRPSTVVTAAYGHSIQLSPVHLAEMAATLTGGGERVRATLLADPPSPPYRERVVSEETSAMVRALLARATQRPGTGFLAVVEGLDVGGKTGTAEKVVNRRYAHDRNIANFVAVFPMRDPQYVVVVMLDEPTTTLPDGRPTHYASWTAAPTAGEIITAIAPLLGVPAEPAAPGGE